MLDSTVEWIIRKRCQHVSCMIMLDFMVPVCVGLKLKSSVDKVAY